MLKSPDNKHIFDFDQWSLARLEAAVPALAKALEQATEEAAREAVLQAERARAGRKALRVLGVKRKQKTRIDKGIKRGPNP